MARTSEYFNAYCWTYLTSKVSQGQLEWTINVTFSSEDIGVYQFIYLDLDNEVLLGHPIRLDSGKNLH